MEEAVGDVEKAVVEWAHPGLRWWAAPGDGWPLVRLYDAALLLGGYVALAAAVLAYNAHRFASDRAERERRIGSTEGGGYRLGGAAAPVKAPTSSPQPQGHALQASFSAAQLAFGGNVAWAAYTEAQALGLQPVCNPFDAAGSGTVPGLVHFFYLGQSCELLETLLLLIQRQELAVTPAHVGTRVARFLLFWLQVRAGYDGDACLFVALCAALRAASHLPHVLAFARPGGLAPRWLQLFGSALQVCAPALVGGYSAFVLGGGCAASDGEGMPRRLAALWLGFSLVSVALWLTSAAPAPGRLKQD